MFCISLIPFILLMIIDFKKSLHMAQQNLYNDDNRFLKWIINDLKQLKTPTKCSIVVIITYLILIAFRLDYKIIVSIYFFLVCLVIFIIKIKIWQAVKDYNSHRLFYYLKFIVTMFLLAFTP